MTEARRQAFVDLGYDVTTVDQAEFLDAYSTFGRKVQTHLLIGPGLSRYRKQLADAASRLRPDAIYVDQAVYLREADVAALRRHCGQLIHYTSEYFWYRSYLYRHLFKTANLFDVHVVSNAHVADYLERRTTARIVRTEFGYDPEHHHPVALDAATRDRQTVDSIFVGHWEPTTENMVHALRESGIGVAVWGSGWHRAKRLVDRRNIRPLSLQEYPIHIVAAKIGLCFLSKWNRNDSAGRTFEIPAIGTFLLAERTNTHAQYFQEGVDAEFFGSAEELVAKARFYIDEDAARKTVAVAGHQRCMSSSYSQLDRVRQLVADIGWPSSS
jgi:spore maturation protein CgeB